MEEPVRASFAEPWRAAEAGAAPSKSTPSRLHAVRHGRGREPAQESSQGGGEPNGFVFCTPGGASLGAKAARSTKKKTAQKGRTPATPFDGSPMQWSPMDTQDSWGTPASSSSTAGAAAAAGSRSSPAAGQEQAHTPRWAHPSSNANIAGGSGGSGGQAGGDISVEMMTRLHLSGAENLPAELQARLNLAGAQQHHHQAPTAAAAKQSQLGRASQAGDGEAGKQPQAGQAVAAAAAAADRGAGASEPELCNRLRTQLHVASGEEDLAQQFSSKVAMWEKRSTGGRTMPAGPAATRAAAAAAAPGAAAPTGSAGASEPAATAAAAAAAVPPAASGQAMASEAQGRAPTAAPDPTGFVFAAGAAGSPVQRSQRQGSRSPASKARKQHSGSAGAGAAAAGTPADAAPPVTSAAAPFMFGSQQQPTAQQSGTMASGEPFASQREPPVPTAAPAAAPFVFGSQQPGVRPASAGQGQTSSSGNPARPASAQSAPQQVQQPASTRGQPDAFGTAPAAPHSQPTVGSQQQLAGMGSQSFVFGAAPAPPPQQHQQQRAASRQDSLEGMRSQPFVFGAAAPAAAGQAQPPAAASQSFTFAAGVAARQPTAAQAEQSAPTFVFGRPQPQPQAGAAAGLAAAPQPFTFGQQQPPSAPAPSDAASSSGPPPPAQQQEREGEAHGGPRKAGPAARRFRVKPSSTSPSQPAPHSGAGDANAFGQPLPTVFPLAATAASPSKQPAAAVGTQQSNAATAAASACEMYRNQGNEAFKNQQYESAYDLYTKAIKALWPYPALHPRLALLLSNRAAAQLSLGKPYQALKDCQMGLKYDPSFARCALRMATCHYRLGDFEAAEQHLAAMQRVAAGEASHLREIGAKQEEVRGHREHVLGVLGGLGHDLSSAAGAAAPLPAKPKPGKEAEGLEAALKELEALWPHVPHAEYLHAAKAQALLQLGRFSQAAEAAKAPVHFDESPKGASHEPWRLWLEAQCAYHEGDYPRALPLLQQLQKQLGRQQAAAEGLGGQPAGDVGGRVFGMGGGAGPGGSSGSERVRLLAAVVPLPGVEEVEEAARGVEAAQRLRQRGNELMKARKYKEAVATYGEALAVPGLSAAFASILHSNRAAAHQGQSQWVQAVADCCRSKALDPQYAKAYSRLAALLTELRHYEAAARALEAALAVPSLPPADKKDYEGRLKEARHAAKRGSGGPRLMGGAGAARQPDHYKLLSLERSCSVEEVRKAYKRLALQMHPDKAASSCRYSCQLGEGGAVVLSVAAAQGRLQEDAKWLFQCLGEAHEVLSDPAKRQDLDIDLRMDDRFTSSAYDVYGGYTSNYGGYSPGGYGGGGSRYGFGSRRGGAGSSGGGGFYSAYEPGTYGAYSPGSGSGRSGAGAGAGAGGESFAERLRRAAQRQQQANAQRPSHERHGWHGFF